jgi:hypothetical protein
VRYERQTADQREPHAVRIQRRGTSAICLPRREMGME